jgi:dTDP-D-glucose 4,6-dehydratase
LGDKSQSVIFDNAKIKRFVPGFCATTRFEQGIRETLNWFEADASRMRIIPQNNELLDNILARWNR